MKTDIFPADSNSNLNDLITAILLRLKSFGLSKLHVGVMRLRRLLTVLIADIVKWLWFLYLLHQSFKYLI